MTEGCFCWTIAWCLAKILQNKKIKKEFAKELDIFRGSSQRGLLHLGPLFSLIMPSGLIIQHCFRSKILLNINYCLSFVCISYSIYIILEVGWELREKERDFCALIVYFEWSVKKGGRNREKMFYYENDKCDILLLVVHRTLGSWSKYCLIRKKENKKMKKEKTPLLREKLQSTFLKIINEPFKK